MSDDFQRVKDQLNILTVITTETGIPMKGKHLEKCPFCEGHGCFSIDHEQGLYKCFQCPAAGDVHTFYQKFYNLDPGPALERAAARAGITIKGPRSPKSSAGLELTVGQTIFLEAAKYYHSHMLDNGGKEYLIARRGHKEDVLKAMQVGWSDGGLVDHLRSKGFTDEQIKTSGLAKEWKPEGKPVLRDFFGKGLAIFPHFHRSAVTHFTQKDPEPDQEKKRKYQLPNASRSKDWRFYNQDALAKHHEAIAVEGENDLLSIMDAGVTAVVGLIGQPADYQVKALQTHCSHKVLFLWFDNDEGGRKFTRQLCNAIKINVRVMTHPSGAEGTASYIKDADDYLRQFQGDKRKEIKRLQEEALPYIAWEIREIAKLTTLEERLNALKERKIFASMSQMVLAEKQVYIEKLMLLGLDKDSIEEQLELCQDVRRALAIYYEGLPKGAKDADPNYISEILWTHFSQNGIFFYNRTADCYLIYHHTKYQIGNNTPFKGLLKKVTGPGPTTLLMTREPGRSVVESLMCEAYNSGKRMDRVSWIHTDRKTDTLYVNLNAPNKNILKISADGIEEIPNGMNEDGVLLGESDLMLPINYIPDADIAEGMTALKELVFDWMTCDREQRYLFLCWFISAFLLEFAPYMALMKFSGAYESGKSTPARFFSLLMYGAEHLFDASTAGAYSASSSNPLILLDDLESEDLTKSLSKFLRLAATKGEKLKRATGSDRATVEEKPSGLIGITAIDPLLQAAVISRTFDVEFDKKYIREGFVEDEIKRELEHKRDLIMSSILKLISKEVLPNLKDRKKYITLLRTDHPKHSKRRMDEYLSVLMLILNKIIKYVPYYEEDAFLHGIETGEVDIRRAWIEYQNNRSKDNETQANNIIKLLDSLVREYMAKMKDLAISSHPDYLDEKGRAIDVFVYTHPDYHIEMIKTQPRTIVDEATKEPMTVTTIEFTAMSADVVAAFDRYCRNIGQANPYSSVSVFGQRLKGEKPVLLKAGWELVTDPKKPHIEPYFKMLRGDGYYKFRRTIYR